MLSLRSFTRALPKGNVLRFASRVSARNMSALHHPATSMLLRRTSLAPATSRLSALPMRKAFGTTALRLQEDATEGSTDQELSATLASELQLERESSGSSELPAELQEFLTTSEFQIQDTAGDEEVVLTKPFGSETIRITFSVSDLSTEHDPDAFLQDRALQDESFDELDAAEGRSGKKNINTGSSTNFAQAPEDALSESDRAATGGAGDPDASSALGADDDAGFPVNMNITITKPGQQGALHFGVMAHDGAVAIERAHFFQDASHADAQSAETQWTSRNKYTGPPFGNLDESLQEVMERYLEERGINTSLALWVPEYIEWKEQREYMAWLEATKNFVDA